MHDHNQHSLPVGLYESLLTSELERSLAQLVDRYRADPLDVEESADRLAMHAASLVERTVASLPSDQRVIVGTEIVRAIAAVLDEQSKQSVVEQAPLPGGRVLRAVHAVAPDGRPAVVASPLIPLLDTALLTNAPGEPALSKQIASEIDSADRIDVMIAFIRFTGIRPLLDFLRTFVNRGRQLRILTTTYTGSTEPRALDALAGIGAEIRVSYDVSSTRLHAKAWLFHRGSGSSTAYVGSSNLTHSAQVLGLEWNVRVSGMRNPSLFHKAQAAFDAAWENGDFVPYDPHVFADAIKAATSPGSGSDLLLSPIELRLEPFQERLLEQIAVSRMQGHHRNLLVAATGTGKTVMAAVDYARLAHQLPRTRLLFVAHRSEILEQSMRTFRHALREPSFGELWVGGRRPTGWEHVFASVQSIAAAGVDAIDPEHFDIVIIDEFHHAAAPSYQSLLDRLRPRELLGLTATPERTDGMPVLHWFGDRIAAELRLWDAIEQQRLAPFHYYGIHDSLDLRDVPWRRGRGYDTEALSNLVTGDTVHARTVIHQVGRHVPDVTRMRALGFCVSVSHANFMAAQFAAAGIPAAAVTGATPEHERRDALTRLREGTINAVFSVDLFNEGVDVQVIDTLIMLRPTDSATVFLQQLGRGLRRSVAKSVCTVLDFVGHQHREFRFDQRFRALLGGTRKELQQQVEQDFPYLPSGCHLVLDQVSKEIVLSSIRNALPSRWPQLVSEVTSLAAAGGPVTLASYLSHSGLSLEDVYANNRCWSDLLHAAGIAIAQSGPRELPLRRAIGRLLHIDDLVRLDTYQRFVASPTPPRAASGRESALLRMLAVSLAGQELKNEDLPAAVDLVWQHPQVLAELREVFAILRDNVDHFQTAIPGRPDVPLQVHARYTRQEILAAMHQKAERAATPTWREGVHWAPSQRADLFVFTIEKTASHFSPTTRYRDYAISRELIHWESQARTKENSATGRRYQTHAATGSDVYLFARQSNAERAFFFIGPATYVSHVGEEPMAITWRLAFPLPGDVYVRMVA